ncbi:MAG: glycosyltransferase family 4 protein [Thermoanaerobaculia bacterium]
MKTLADHASTSWLTDDLLAELARKGHAVDAIVFDRTARLCKGTRELPGGGVAHIFPMVRLGPGWSLLRAVHFASRWARSWLEAMRVARRNDYDLVISSSIASFFFGFVRTLKLLRKAKKSLLFIWDFFPIHHQQYGRVTDGFFARVLYWCEAAEVRSHDYVALMSERNREFFSSYHPRFTGSTFILPVWGPPETVDAPRQQRQNSEICIVFGGQMARGRGLDQVVRVADAYRQQLRGVRFLLVGDGPLRTWIENEIGRRRIDNISLLGWMDRTSYLAKLRECDIGLVVTVPGVTVPTFPSKVIDFMRSRLPVIACVEPTTDFGLFVEEVGFGYYAEAGDDTALVDVMRRLAFETDERTRQAMGERGYVYFQERMTVTSAVEIIEKQCAVGRGRAVERA